MRFLIVLITSASALYLPLLLPENQWVPAVTRASYSRYAQSNVNTEDYTDLEVDAYTSSANGMDSILFYEPKKLNCLDEFIGLQNFDLHRVTDALTKSGYNFCGENSGEAIVSDYIIEPKLSCLNAQFTRLDCKFTSKDGSNEQIFASRTATKGPAVFSFRSKRHFTNRITCIFPKVKDQMDECSWLLNGWLKVNNLFNSEERVPVPAKAGNSKKSANAGVASDEEGEEKTKDADDTKEKDGDNSTLYYMIGGGVGLIVLIGIGFAVMGGDKAKKPDSGERRHHSKGHGTQEIHADPEAEGQQEEEALIVEKKKKHKKKDRS